MTHLLIPGRHHLLTNFQAAYLEQLIRQDLSQISDVHGQPLHGWTPLESLVWAVTSANHANTRRNPLPAHRREAAIERLAIRLGIPSFVYLVDDVGHTPRFADYLLKKLEVDSRGNLRLTPQNAIVACSTPEVIELYEQLGFRILPVELASLQPTSYRAAPPWRVLEQLVEEEATDSWKQNPRFIGQVELASRELLLKYQFDERIVDLYRSPLLNADGELTDTRDYNAYVRAFDEGAERKYEQIRDFVRPGRICDIGCCTGAVLQQLAQDDRFRESDLYGIEVARKLFSECQFRKQRGDFANDHVFFYQQDFSAGLMFPRRSIDTFTTFSLTHEIESYAGRQKLLDFIRLLQQQLAAAGRWINLDVIGPDQPDLPVFLQLNDEDGRNEDWDRPLAQEERSKNRDYLNGLSTYARFMRFANDYRSEEGYELSYRVCSSPRWRTVEITLRDACEFLSKKDYLDNWHSEMHETFCFWSLQDWIQAVADAGLRVLPGTRAFSNPWIVENRYQGKVQLGVASEQIVPNHQVQASWELPRTLDAVPFTVEGRTIEPIAWDSLPTNMLLIAENN